jgi:Flp pilus assembly protein TadG
MIRRLLRSQAGTAVVEFAVLLPTLIMLLMGVVEIGRYGYLAILCTHAARAGVEYGAQNNFTGIDTVGIQNAALKDAANSGWTVTTSHNCQQNNVAISCAGQPVSGEVYYLQVTVTGQFSSMFHYPGIPSPITYSSTSTMRLNSQ